MAITRTENPIWTQAGATTLAYKGVVDEMKRYEPARWQATAKGRQDVGELHLDAPEPPKQTFDKSPFILKDDSREVRFYYLGWAHTRATALSICRKRKCSAPAMPWSTGLITSRRTPTSATGPPVVRKAQKFDVQHLLPGHGGPSGKEVLEGQYQYMALLHKAVDDAVKQGKKLTDIVDTGSTKMVYGNQVPATTSITLPEKVKNWVDLSLQRT